MEGHQQLQVPLQLDRVGQLHLDRACQLRLEVQPHQPHELLKPLHLLKALRLLKRLRLLKVVVALDAVFLVLLECRVI